MKTVKIYLTALLHKILTFAVASFVFYFIHGIFADGIYPALAKLLPDVLPIYNAVSEKEAYHELRATLALYSGILAVFAVEYFAGAIANERFEFMIRKTDGMYLVREGARLYFPRYALPDLFATLLTVAAFHTAAFFIPAEIREKFLLGFFDMSAAYATRIGLIGGILLHGAAYFTATLLSGLRAIDKWRGKWLSASTM